MEIDLSKLNSLFSFPVETPSKIYVETPWERKTTTDPQNPTESEQETQKNTSKGEETQMETKMQICGSEITVKEYNGERVVTLADVDTVHQRVQGTASRNFLQNRDKLVEGVDYYIAELTDNEIRGQFGVGKNAGRTLILLTESGYLMLVKSLRDDLAWMVQRELVNGYFKLRRVAEAVRQATEPEDEFDTVCRALQIVDKRVKQLEARNVVLESRNDELERKIDRDRGKVAFAEAVQETGELISVGDLAKILYQTGTTDMGQRRLFARLCEDGYVMYSGEDNVPQQKAIEAGLLKLIEYTYARNSQIFTAKKTMVTPKGKLYFCKRYGKRG